jgi:hypothetical protein
VNSSSYGESSNRDFKSSEELFVARLGWREGRAQEREAPNAARFGAVGLRSSNLPTLGSREIGDELTGAAKESSQTGVSGLYIHSGRATLCIYR